MITNWQYHPSKDEKLLFTLLLFLVVIILLSFATSNRVGNKWKICTAVKIGMVGISYGMKRILREMGGGGERKREREGVRVNIMYFRLIRMPCEKRFSATAIVYSLYYYYDIILVRFPPHFCLFYSLTHHLSSFVDASSIHHDFEIKHSTSMMRKMESSMSKHIGLYVCVCVNSRYMNIMNWSLFNFIPLLPSTLIIWNEEQKEATHTQHIRLCV